MKRFLSIFMCLVLVLSISAIFVACDKDKDPAATTTVATTTIPEDDDGDTVGGGSSKPRTTASATTTATTASVPEGYKLFSDAVISFACPENFTSKMEDGKVEINSPTATTNIRVDDQTPGVMLELRLEDFKNMMGASLGDDGMTISDVTLTEHTVNGLSVRAFSFSTTMTELQITVFQTMYIFAVDSHTYSITVTEYTHNTELHQTILNTLSKVEK